MRAAMRATAAVLAGMAAWGVLWSAGTQATQALLPGIVQRDVRLEHVGVLSGYIAYSVALSVLAGYLTARLAGTRPTRTVWALAVIQLLVGVYFEVIYWSLLPAWYHVVFLALVVPATVLGGTLRRERPRASHA